MMKPTSNWPRVREYLLALILCTCFACSTADDWEARFVTEEVTISPISGTLHNSSRKLPDLRFQSQEEGSYLKFHRCHDEGEVYAAAYLVTKSHLLQHSITYDLKVVRYRVNRNPEDRFVIFALFTGKYRTCKFHSFGH